MASVHEELVQVLLACTRLAHHRQYLHVEKAESSRILDLTLLPSLKLQTSGWVHKVTFVHCLTCLSYANLVSTLCYRLVVMH